MPYKKKPKAIGYFKAKAMVERGNGRFGYGRGGLWFQERKNKHWLIVVKDGIV